MWKESDFSSKIVSEGWWFPLTTWVHTPLPIGEPRVPCAAVPKGHMAQRILLHSAVTPTMVMPVVAAVLTICHPNPESWVEGSPSA